MFDAWTTFVLLFIILPGLIAYHLCFKRGSALSNAARTQDLAGTDAGKTEPGNTEGER